MYSNPVGVDEAFCYEVRGRLSPEQREEVGRTWPRFWARSARLGPGCSEDGP